MARTRQQVRNQYLIKKTALNSMKAGAEKKPTWGEMLAQLTQALRAMVAVQFLVCDNDYNKFVFQVYTAQTTVLTQELYEEYPLVEHLAKKLMTEYVARWFLEELRAINTPLTLAQHTLLRVEREREFDELPIPVQNQHQRLVVQSRRHRLRKLPEIEAARQRLVNVEAHKQAFLHRVEDFPEAVLSAPYSAYIYLKMPLNALAMLNLPAMQDAYEAHVHVWPRYKTIYDLLQEDDGVEERCPSSYIDTCRDLAPLC